METKQTSLLLSLLLCIFFTTLSTKLSAPPPLCKRFSSEAEARNFLYNVELNRPLFHASGADLLMFKTLDYATAQDVFYVVSVTTQKHVERWTIEKPTLFVIKKKVSTDNAASTYFFVIKCADGTYRNPFKVRPLAVTIEKGLQQASTLTKIYAEHPAAVEGDHESGDSIRMHVIPTETDITKGLLSALHNYEKFTKTNADFVDDFLNLKKAIRKLINTPKNPANARGMLIIKNRDAICTKINNALAETRMLEGQEGVISILQRAVERVLILGGLTKTPWSERWDRITTTNKATKTYDKNALHAILTSTFDAWHKTLQRLDDDNPHSIVLRSIKRICQSILGVNPESSAETVQALVEELDEIISKHPSPGTTRILEKAKTLLDHWQPDARPYIPRTITGTLDFRKLTQKPRIFSDDRLQPSNPRIHLRPSASFHPQLESISEDHTPRKKSPRGAVLTSTTRKTKSRSPGLTPSRPSTTHDQEVRAPKRPGRSLAVRPVGIEPTTIKPQTGHRCPDLNLMVDVANVNIDPQPPMHAPATTQRTVHEEHMPYTQLMHREKKPQKPAKGAQRKTPLSRRLYSETESGSSTTATSSDKEGGADRTMPRSTLPGQSNP